MLRLIDANLNRMNEGLRVLEDIARFLLNDATISARLRALRHELSIDDTQLKTALLDARDSARDVGANIEPDSEPQRQDVASIIAANASRVEESLRVLEEFAKLPHAMLESERFKKARFAVYEIGRELTGRVLRRASRIVGLYLVMDAEALRGRDELDIAEKAIRGGTKVIQLRDKRRNKRELLSRARLLKTICAPNDVVFIVNDDLDITVAADADGLHLGQDDLPIPTARKLLPISTIIGCTTRTSEAALQAQSEGADYIAVGSIFPTTSKTDTRVVGLEALRCIRQAVSLPIVAIGGINTSNIKDVLAAGADSVAVVSAVLGASDIEEAARRLVDIIGSN